MVNRHGSWLYIAFGYQRVMMFTFAKSLDRPVDIFGVKGSWIKVFLLMVGISVFTGIIIGSMTSSGIGISICIIGAIGSFIICQVLQNTIHQRHISKLPLTGKMNTYVKRRETLSSVLLPDPRYKRVKELERLKNKD